MIINNKWGQVAVVAFIALMGFLFVRRVKELDREGMPTVSYLRQVSDEVAQALGVTDANEVNVVNKTTYLLVERDITSPRLTDAMVQKAVAQLNVEGWVKGKAKSNLETTLCKRYVIIDIDKPDAPGASGYLGVNWGDAVVRCPSI